ncbi:hypothetical protein ROBYS_13230 [Roseobacter sp. OBYS 0001]|nr:hypothetical protein ROBYS_13230 [Roseobacter sp. OBYS 0001]
MWNARIAEHFRADLRVRRKDQGLGHVYKPGGKVKDLLRDTSAEIPSTVQGSS